MKIQGNNPVESQGQSTRTEKIDEYHEKKMKSDPQKADNGKDKVTISEEAKEIQKSAEAKVPDRTEETNRTADTGENNYDSTTGPKAILDHV